MKKIILLLILIFPTIIFAKTDYKVVTNHTLTGNILNMEEYFNFLVDNGSSYMITTDKSITRIDKKSGIVSTLNIEEGTIIWINYDQNNNKLTSTESSHYFVISEENSNYILRLVDNNLNVIKKLTLSNINYPIPFKDRIVLYVKDGTTLTINTYDKNLNYIDSDNIESEDFESFQYNYNNQYFEFRYTVQEKFIINNNYKLEEYELTEKIGSEDNKVYIYNYQEERKTKEIELPGEVMSMTSYEGINYIVYENNNKYYMATFDKELNKLKEINLNEKLNVNDFEIEPLHLLDGNFFAELSSEFDFGGIQNYYEIDKDLNIKKVKENEVTKSNLLIEGKEIINELNLPDDTSRRITNNIIEKLGDNKEIEIITANYIKDKYYFVYILYDEEEDKGYIYLEIYNNKQESLKKTPIELDYIHFYPNISLISDKLVVSLMDEDLTSSISKVFDLEGNEIETEFEIFSNENYCSYIDGNNLILLSYKKISESNYQFNVKYIKNTYSSNISDFNNIEFSQELYYGEEIEIIINKEDNKVIKNIIIKDEKGNIIPVVDNKFTMPDSNISINIEYEKEVINPFTKDNIILSIITLSLCTIVFYLTKKNMLND